MDVQARERLLRSTIQTALQANLASLEQLYNIPRNNDIIMREFAVLGHSAAAVYLEGMAGSEKIADNVIRPCLSTDLPAQSGDIMDMVVSNVLYIAETVKTDLFSEINEAVLDGKTVLLIDECAQAVIMETRDYDKREVDKTLSENVVIGPQQGFIENLRTNLTLVHRILRSDMLVSEHMTIGVEIPTKLALVYLDGVVNEQALDEIRRRIMSLKIAYLPDSGQLEALIEDRPMFLFPQILQTERPDRVAHCVSEGQIAIMVDNSPFALIAPITFFHLMHASDDSFMRWQYALFTRLARTIGIFCSLYLPGLYIAFTTFHAHIIPISLLTSIAETRAAVPFPILTEIIIMEISFFLINEAGIRIPSQVGSVLGIVGALILGQAAVSASIISPILIIIVSLTGLGNYAAPTYSVSYAMQILRFGLLIGGVCLGLFGIILVTVLYLCILCDAKSIGISMLAPFAPYYPHNPDLLTRLPLWMQNRRLFLAQKNNWLSRHVKARAWEDGGKEG